MLVGIITRKDLMTFEIVEKIKLHKAEAMLRGWAHRWKIQQRIKARERRRAEARGRGRGACWRRAWATACRAPPQRSRQELTNSQPC